MDESFFNMMGIKGGSEILEYIKKEAQEMEELQNKVISILKSDDTYNEAGEMKDSLFEKIAKILHKICYMPLVMYERFAISKSTTTESQLEFNLMLVKMNLSNFLSKIDVLERFDWGFCTNKEELSDGFKFIVKIVLEDKECRYNFKVAFQLQNIDKIGGVVESYVTH